MYLVETYEAEKTPPYLKFEKRDIERAETLEAWGTSFTDPGPDYTEFKLIDEGGEVLVSTRVEGY